MARFAPTDHCDGERFFNPHGPSARSFLDLPKWWWERARGGAVPWPKLLPPVLPVTLPVAAAPRTVAATLIGHATFLLQFASGTNVLTDPVFSSRAGPFGFLGPRRLRPPALRLGELPAVHAVVLSHNHYDHLDLASLRWLSRHRQPIILAPLGLKSWLGARGVDRVEELDWWERRTVTPGLDSILTPAQHWSSRWPWDRCRTLWGGWFLSGAEGSAYFAGDTGWGPHFAATRSRLGPPAVAFLPIGAYEPRWFMESVHMNPDEAVRAHLALGARWSVGMHHRTFRLTDEGFADPEQALAAARDVHGVGPDAFIAPEGGATVVLPL